MHSYRQSFSGSQERGGTFSGENSDQESGWSNKPTLGTFHDSPLSVSSSMMPESESSDHALGSKRRENIRRQSKISENLRQSSARSIRDSKWRPNPIRSSAPLRSYSESTYNLDRFEDDWKEEDDVGMRRIPRPSRYGSPDSGSMYSDGSGTESFATHNHYGRGEINWLWICQADVIPGYFATPWKDLFSESVCLGVIATMLKVLEDFTGPSTLKFVERYPQCEKWAEEGRSTHPS